MMVANSRNEEVATDWLVGLGLLDFGDGSGWFLVGKIICGGLYAFFLPDALLISSLSSLLVVLASEMHRLVVL